MAFPSSLTFRYTIDGVDKGTNYSYANGNFVGTEVKKQYVHIYSHNDPDNCVFSHWTFDGVIPEWNGAPTERDLMSGERGEEPLGQGRLTCIANFVTEQPPQSYTVTTLASPIGSGTTTGDGVYQEHALCTITATPNTGYRFIKWVLSTGAESLTRSYTFSVEQNTDCIAYFVRKTGLILRDANNNIILRYGNTLLRDD